MHAEEKILSRLGQLFVGERKVVVRTCVCVYVHVCLLKLRSQPTVEAAVWLDVNTEQ